MTSASIIIPAFNEAAVIGRCLRALDDGARSGEFEVIVACNGCTDDTATVARDSAPQAIVFSIDEPSKTRALNAADEIASCFPRVYLDADLVVSVEDVRALLNPILKRRVMATSGRMLVDSKGASWPVRAFYSVWLMNPYISEGKFGGIFALSRNGHQRLGKFPHVTNDDEYVRRLFDPEERETVEDCHFRLTAPRTLRDLVRIRTRAMRGNRELDRLGFAYRHGGSVHNFRELLIHAAFTPGRWFQVGIYIAISLCVRLRVTLLGGRTRAWERDESSRMEVADAG